jgi:hypothetical protein
VRALLTAPVPQPRDAPILGGEQMALQIHESVGYAIELDRILGWGPPRRHLVAGPVPARALQYGRS